MDEWLGERAARVILPITDPYVVHHGALGSFGTAYLPEDADHAAINAKIKELPEMLEVLAKEEAVSKYELPIDRIGDLTMVSTGNMTIGTSEDRHNLAALNEPFRSRGGLTEQEVSFIVNRVIDLPRAPVLRNFDAFYFVCIAAALEVELTKRGAKAC